MGKDRYDQTSDYIRQENLTGLFSKGYVVVDHCCDEENDEEDDEELCEEEEKFECPRNFFEAVERLKHLLVAVEFECGGCCKKAVGILRCVKPDFIQLFRPPNKLVQIQMFCPGLCDFTTECACEANIRFERIISVEQVAIQHCP